MTTFQLYCSIEKWQYNFSMQTSDVAVETLMMQNGELNKLVEIANTLTISKDYVGYVVHQYLYMRKVCEKWILQTFKKNVSMDIYSGLYSSVQISSVVYIWWLYLNRNIFFPWQYLYSDTNWSLLFSDGFVLGTVETFVPIFITIGRYLWNVLWSQEIYGQMKGLQTNWQA